MNRSFLKVTFYNYLFTMIYIIVTFIAVPITLKYLGTERYGIWQTIMTLIGFVALTNFGIGNGLRNRVTEYFTEDDKVKLKKVISSAYITISVIAVAILIVAIPIFAIFNYNLIYTNINIKHNEIAIAFIITISGFGINFILGLIKSISYGIHKSHLVTLSQLISSIISLILTLFMVGKEPKLYIMAIIYSVSNIIVNIVLSAFIFSLDNKYIPNIKLFDRIESKHLYSLGMSFFILEVMALLMTTSDNFIVAKLVGASDVTNYSIVNKVFNMIPTLFSIILIQVWSNTAKESTLGNYKNIKKMINKLELLLIPTAIVLIILVLLFNIISTIWLGKKINVSFLLIVSSALYAFVTCLNGIFVNIQNGLGIIKYQIISYTIAVILQLPLAYFMVKNLNLGVGGVMLSKFLIIVIPAIINSIHIKLYLKSKCLKRGIV